MNSTNILRTFFSINAMFFVPRVHLSPELLRTLGHTVIASPIVLEVLKQIDIPFILVDYGDIVDGEITGAIIAGEDGFIQEQVSMMMSQSGWMARAMVVVIAFNPHPKLFKYFWKRRVINVVLVTNNGSYAYNPFNDTLFQVDQTDIAEVLEERWRDLHGYPITVAMYKHSLSFRMKFGISLGSGIDGTAVYEMAKYWNMTVDLIDTGQNAHFIQTTDKLLHTGQVDLSLNARFLSREKKHLDNPEYTTCIYTDTVVIVLKVPDKLRGWEIFGRIFKWMVWVAALISLLVMNRAILWMTKETHWPKSFWASLKALCNVPINHPPSSTSDRIILFAGFLVGMVLVTVFQASLYHFIKEGITKDRMKTIPQVINNFQLVTDSEIIKDILHSYEIGSHKVKVDLKIIPLSNEIFESHALVTRSKEINLLMETGEMRNDLYIVDEKVCTIPLSYVLKRGSPFLNRLSDYTSRVFEAGLWSIWYRITLERLADGNRTRNERPEFKVLTMRDVEVAFFALIIGHLISTITFLIEVLITAIQLGKLRWVGRFVRVFLNCMYPTH